MDYFDINTYIDTMPVGLNVVENLYSELLKHYPYINARHRNEPFFTHEILCHDADGVLQALVRYGWSAKSNKWAFECLIPNE